MVADGGRGDAEGEEVVGVIELDSGLIEGEGPLDESVADAGEDGEGVVALAEAGEGEVAGGEFDAAVGVDEVEERAGDADEGFLDGRREESLLVVVVVVGGVGEEVLDEIGHVEGRVEGRGGGGRGGSGTGRGVEGGIEGGGFGGGGGERGVGDLRVKRRLLGIHCRRPWAFGGRRVVINSSGGDFGAKARRAGYALTQRREAGGKGW